MQHVDIHSDGSDIRREIAGEIEELPARAPRCPWIEFSLARCGREGTEVLIFVPPFGDGPKSYCPEHAAQWRRVLAAVAVR